MKGRLTRSAKKKKRQIFLALLQVGQMKKFALGWYHIAKTPADMSESLILVS